jgi:hypothetical protein
MFGLWQARNLRDRDTYYNKPKLRRANAAEEPKKDIWGRETFYGPNRYN